MIHLSTIHSRFAAQTDTKKWFQLGQLLMSEDAENVVTGIQLLMTLNEALYYDAVCSLFVEETSGNWLLKEGLDCKQPLFLILQLIRMTKEGEEHELYQAGKAGYFRKISLLLAEATDFFELDPSSREQILNDVKEMISIPAGDFYMGKLPQDNNDHGDETPRRLISLEQDFLVMKYPVTQALVSSLLDYNPSVICGATLPMDNLNWMDCIHLANRLSEQDGFDIVYDVKGHMVHMNMKSNGYRLLTEAEWEYVARAQEYHLYSGSNDLDIVGWFYDNFDADSEQYLKPVGTKQPNAFGIYDMSGNIFEWVWDRYGGYTPKNSKNPTGPKKGSYRVLRGGFWNNKKWSSRVSSRFFFEPTKRKNRFGFRLCRVPY